LRRLATVGALLIAGCGSSVDRPLDATSEEGLIVAGSGATNGVIAYSSISEHQIFWTIHPDGSDRTRVHVDVPGFVGVPSWSPDGTRIVFDVNAFDDPHPKGGNYDIYLARADGSEPTRLTSEKVDHSPVWSADGTRIAFVHGWGDQQIRVMNADGSDPHQIAEGSFPSWSPDGTKIAFVVFDGSSSDIYLMNTDGSNVQRLTNSPAHENKPAWSPDGRRIAFTSDGDGDAGIYAISPDGTGRTELLDDPDPANLGFAWSPDGTKIAVVSIRGPGNDRNVYVLNVATGELTPIGERGAFYGPSWQPLRGVSPTPSDQTPTGWTEHPLPSQVRDGMSVVWAGSQLLAWGGCDPAVEDQCEPDAGGFGFDPVTQSWRRLDDAPAAGAGADTVWTGREAIFLLEGEANHPVGDRLEGQAYDPAAGTWRTIAAAPIAPRSGAVAVWTGSEVIVWGGGNPGDPTSVSGAAYDPVADVWRRIADAPVGLNLASGMWTGREVLVFGSLLDNRNIADTGTSVGAAYNPVADTWREMPPSALSPQATSAVWVVDRMVAWDYELRSQEYDPVRDAWSAPIKMPLDFSECYPDSAVVRNLVFAFFCGRAALYDTGSGTWEEVSGGLLDEEVESEAYGRAIKLWRFAQLASTGETMYLLAEGITLEKTGEACYGCPGAPVSFWAFRPPA
jgi:hypothetical protein